MKPSLKLFPFLISILLISPPALASGPRFYFDQTNGAEAGSNFSVRILLDTDKEVNAYSVNLRYSADMLGEAGFNDSRSIIDIWQNRSFSDGEIKLSGGSLKPFSGNGGELITVNFKALKEGVGGIAFGDSEVYLADGKGTKILPESGVLHIGISGATAGTPGEAKDATPPKIKFVSLAPDPFNQKQKLLTFLASDEGSGIKTEEVRTWSYLWWGAWAPVENPAAISASVWAVEFRAVDNNNNAVDKIVYNWGAFPNFIVMMIGTVLSAVFVAWYVLRKASQRL